MELSIRKSIERISRRGDLMTNFETTPTRLKALRMNIYNRRIRECFPPTACDYIWYFILALKNMRIPYNIDMEYFHGLTCRDIKLTRSIHDTHK